jgi:hypothetical protein
MTNCPNLKELFGDRYRIKVEESHGAERGTEIKRNVDPWLLIIPCQNGHICPWDEDLLAACTSHRRFVVRDLVAVGCTVVQDGDDGVNATFPVEAFDEVAEIMKPWKRRRISDEQRQAAVERLRRYREKAGTYEKAIQETPERPISTLADV